MWRNSASFSSKLLSSSNPNSGSTFLSSAISTANYAFGRSLSHSPSSTGDLKLGFPKLDRIPSSGFASSAATAIDASLRARDVVDLARHYGRCYWELSKARLRLGSFDRTKFVCCSILKIFAILICCFGF